MIAKCARTVPHRRLLSGPRGFFRKRTTSASAGPAGGGKKTAGPVKQSGGKQPSKVQAKTAASTAAAAATAANEAKQQAAEQSSLQSGSIEEAPKRRFLFWNRN